MKEGDRVAQLIIEKIETPEATEVDVRRLLRMFFYLLLNN